MDEKKRILDWFLSHDDIPAQMRDKVHLWLLEHADDPEVRQRLDEQAAFLPEEGSADVLGLLRLRRSVSRGRKRRPALWTAVVATVILALVTVGLFSLRPGASSAETFITSGSGISRYTLPDGTAVRLAPGSTLSYAEKGKYREANLEGSAFFEVSKDASRPFRVHFADGSQAEVLGTSFSVESNGGLQEIVLRTGAVRVTLPTLPESVTLHPDQRLSVEGKTVRIDPVRSEVVCHWTDEALVFVGTPFEDVLACLAYRYNVKMDNRSGVPPDKLITMTVGAEPLGEVMALLDKLLSIRSDIQPHAVILHSDTKQL